MSENEKYKVVANKDNESLHAWGNKNFTIGSVDEVNGAEAVEVPDFAPTRHELIQIVKNWAKKRLDNAWFFFLTRQTGSTEWRIDLKLFNHSFVLVESLAAIEECNALGCRLGVSAWHLQSVALRLNRLAVYAVCAKHRPVCFRQWNSRCRELQ